MSEQQMKLRLLLTSTTQLPRTLCVPGIPRTRTIHDFKLHLPHGRFYFN